MDPVEGVHQVTRQPRDGRGRGRGSWAPLQTQDQRSLRRPHHGTTAGNSDQPGIQLDGGTGDIVKYSTLSVDAAEFVPKNFTPGPPQQATSGWPRQSVQNRLDYARQPPHPGRRAGPPLVLNLQRMRYIPNPEYQLYMNLSSQEQQQYCPDTYCVVGSGDHGRHQPERNELDVGGNGEEVDGLRGMMGQLEGAMRSLTLSPGRFDSLVAPLVDAITPCLTHATQAQTIVSAIVRHSINEGNFRYSGARLCTFLDNAALGERTPSIFRETLLARCREETEKCTSSWLQRTTPEDEQKEKTCHGLILFLAELVTQMESDPASTLGKLLIELMSAVLQRPAANTAKHICQALKLAGQTLERDNCGGGAEMENVMRRLTGLVTEGQVDIHVGRMVNSVDELRRGNWGRIVSTPGLYNPPTNPTQTPLEGPTEPLSNEPVFYGPDGNVITAEERRFLQDLTGNAPDIEDFGDGDVHEDPEVDAIWADDADDGGMDDDIAAAYEQFLKLTPNKGNGRARR